MGSMFDDLIPQKSTSPAPAKKPKVGMFDDLIPAKKAAPAPVSQPQAMPVPATATAPAVAAPQAPDYNTRNGAAVMGMADTMGFGFADEIASGIEVGVRKIQGDARPASQIYNNFLARTRGVVNDLQKQAPGDYLGGQALGALATMGSGGMVRSAGVIKNAIQGAKTGFVSGATYGAGSSDGTLEDRAKAGLIGGGTGLVVGGSLPLVGAVVKAPMKAVGSVVGGVASKARSLVSNSAGKTNLQAPTGYAVKKIAAIAEREGKTIDQVRRELQALQKTNPDALLIDALGESGGRLGRAVSNRGSKVSRELREAVVARQIGQNDRITGEVSKRLGDPDSFHSTLDQTIANLRENAKPLYEKAYRTPINYDVHGKPISDAWKRVPERYRGRVVSAANDILVAEGKKAKRIGTVIGRQANGKVTPLPTVEQWDYIKRGLDAVIQQENTKGAAGGMSALGRALDMAKKGLVKSVDDAVPEFAAARKVYSDDLSVKNALELGRKSFSADAETIGKTMASLDKASQDTFRIGYARALTDRIDSMGGGGDAMARVWAAPARRERLKAVFGDQKSFEQFATFARGEEKMRKTYNALSANSTTAQQLADMADAGGGQAADFVGKVATGNITGAVSSAVMNTVRTISGLTEQRADELAQLLLQSKVPQGFVNKAGRYELSKEQRAVVAKFLRGATTRGAAYSTTSSQDTSRQSQ